MFALCLCASAVLYSAHVCTLEVNAVAHMHAQRLRPQRLSLHALRRSGAVLQQRLCGNTVLPVMHFPDSARGAGPSRQPRRHSLLTKILALSTGTLAVLLIWCIYFSTVLQKMPEPLHQFIAPAPSAIDQLGLVKLQLEKKFWHRHDPQICVLVSTYMKHGLALTALVASLLATGYPRIDVILLDTDIQLNSTDWLHNTASVLNKRYDTPGMRDTVHVAARTQRHVVDEYPNVGPDYG
jgi:hypothetical protein